MVAEDALDVEVRRGSGSPACSCAAAGKKRPGFEAARVNCAKLFAVEPKRIGHCSGSRRLASTPGWFPRYQKER